MSIIKNIQQIRESKKITRKEISEFLHIAEGTYRDIENGKIRLSLENYLLICQFIKISPMELLKEDTEHYILLTDQDIKSLNLLTDKINNQTINQNIKINDNHGNIEITNKKGI